MHSFTDWLQSMPSSSQFIPHGHCYLWQPNLVWLHVLSDGFIAIAYFSIPIMLFYFVQKREQIVFRNVFLLFGLFIITCGTTHLISILTLWYPVYWLSGTVKAITAVVSIYTALTLLPVIPLALALPSPEKLSQVNQQLEKEIKERKQAEAELQRLNQELESRVSARTASLRKSEQRFRSLFESAPDFLYVLNDEGLIQQVNSTVIQRSGYSEAALVGQPLLAFLSEQWLTSCQDDWPKLLRESSHHQAMEFVCKDGQVLTMDCACTVVADEAAVETIVLVLQRDVTERNRVEKERAELLMTLKEAERRWQSFLRNVRLMVVGLSQSGTIEYVNPYCADLLDCPLEQAMCQPWIETFIPQEEQVQTQAILQDVLNRKNHPNYQSSLVTRTGEPRIISWNTTLLQDSQGQPSGTLSIGEDITERDAVARMKNEFISVVSHELRTPLTAIHGALDLLSSGLIDATSERGQHVFEIAVENSDRLVKLVNDILELERLESGKIKLHCSVVSTRELTQRTFELMELVAERSQIQLNVTDTDLPVWADGDRIIQVLTNLVDNAIKFSDPQTVVSLTVSAVGEAAAAIQFTVADEGRGIPPDKTDNIFERFHQVDASDSRRKGGTGLGLSICRSIVQQHGGDLSVKSVLGEGSAFRFTIPTSRL